MATSNTQVLAQLLQRNLVHPDAIQEVLSALEHECVTVNEETLLRRLQKEGKLTNFQAESLLAGRAEELTFGSYIVLERLGAGGMGTVYKARHRRMKRIVAIKVLSRSKTRLPEQVAQFQCEVEAVAQLSHPNIVTAHDAGECLLGHYLVMEYVPGTDLAQAVSQLGPLPLAEGVDYVVQAARALEYAHSKGVVHCDVKPANMLLSPNRTVKVADLGLARFASNFESEPRTEVLRNTISGTLDFMSPEQAFNPSEIDHRSDIYSLGCSLFYLLTGQVIHDGKTIKEKLGAHRMHLQRSLRAVRPDAPVALEKIYLRMTARNISDRYPSMTEVITALEACELPEVGDFLPPNLGAAQVVAPTSKHLGKALTLMELAVLLVEPSRLQAQLIGKQLQSLGIQRVHVATSGQAALGDMLTSQPDVVISAMHLADMTGADMVQRMRVHEELKDVAFVLMSSETERGLLEPALQAGTVAILTKPFDVERLRRALAIVVDFVSQDELRVHNLNVGRLRVLIVDDSRTARRHVRRVLERVGINDIVEASSGPEALDVLRGQRCDLVVSDYNMPEMDGAELVRCVRREGPHRSVPVLVITSETDPDRLESIRVAGASAICSKVFDPKTVCALLENVLTDQSLN